MTMATNIVAYFYNSSKSSADKNDMINNALNGNNNQISPTTTP